MSENKAIPVKANERPKHAPTHRGGPGHTRTGQFTSGQRRTHRTPHLRDQRQCVQFEYVHLL